MNDLWSHSHDWDNGYAKGHKDGYQQGRKDALSIDMDKPMHFTDEQKAWIKNYIIINAQRQRADAIEEIEKAMHEAYKGTSRQWECMIFDLKMRELKEQTE